MKLICTTINSGIDKNGNTRGYHIIKKIGEVVTTVVDIMPLERSYVMAKYPTIIEDGTYNVTAKEFKWWTEYKKTRDKLDSKRLVVCNLRDDIWEYVVDIEAYESGVVVLVTAPEANYPEVLKGVDNLALLLRTFPNKEFKLQPLEVTNS